MTMAIILQPEGLRQRPSPCVVTLWSVSMCLAFRTQNRGPSVAQTPGDARGSEIPPLQGEERRSLFRWGPNVTRWSTTCSRSGLFSIVPSGHKPDRLRSIHFRRGLRARSGLLGFALPFLASTCSGARGGTTVAAGAGGGGKISGVGGGAVGISGSTPVSSRYIVAGSSSSALSRRYRLLASTTFSRP